MSSFSHVYNAHPSYVESMYKQYLENKDSIEKEWRLFFEGFDFASLNGNGTTPSDQKSVISDHKEFGVMSFIHGYRQRGHLFWTRMAPDGNGEL